MNIVFSEHVPYHVVMKTVPKQLHAGVLRKAIYFCVILLRFTFSSETNFKSSVWTSESTLCPFVVFMRLIEGKKNNATPILSASISPR